MNAVKLNPPPLPTKIQIVVKRCFEHQYDEGGGLVTYFERIILKSEKRCLSGNFFETRHDRRVYTDGLMHAWNALGTAGLTYEIVFDCDGHDYESCEFKGECPTHDKEFEVECEGDDCDGCVHCHGSIDGWPNDREDFHADG